MGIHAQHRQRVKDKFRKYGLQGMAPHEVLELLLFFSVPQKDTNPLAHKLIDTFGSLKGVLDAPFEALLQVDGVGEHTATLLKLMVPLLRTYQADTGRSKVALQNTDDTGAYLTGKYFGYRHEMVSIICLDAACNVLAFEEVCQGGITGADFSLRRIIELVIRHTAAYVILAHNHPSSLAIPSDSDIQTTAEVARALRTVGVRLIDHIIIAPDDYVSMRDSRAFAHLFK